MIRTTVNLNSHNNTLSKQFLIAGSTLVPLKAVFSNMNFGICTWQTHQLFWHTVFNIGRCVYFVYSHAWQCLLLVGNWIVPVTLPWGNASASPCPSSHKNYKAAGIYLGGNNGKTRHKRQHYAHVLCCTSSGRLCALSRQYQYSERVRHTVLHKVEHQTYFNPFTPESDQCQNSPAASQEIWHHTVWRTWPFIAYSDEKWLYYKFLLHHSYNRFLKGWENTLFELRSERVK